MLLSTLILKAEREDDLNAVHYLNLAAVALKTEAEGPGCRIALWVQGCMRRCVGCCNPDMQPFHEVCMVETNDLISVLDKAQSMHKTEGITFVGGEPLLQAEGLADIAVWAHKVGMTVLVFTGFRYPDVLSKHLPGVERLLTATDLLVDGPYEQEHYDLQRPWIGSTNQKVHHLTDAYPAGIEYQAARQMEVRISAQDIIVNGWPYLSQDFNQK